jgi:hypothetical protein
MPVTVAPLSHMPSESRPPPQPTSSTRLPASVQMAVDPVQAQGVDVVQRLEIAAGIPPAMRKLAEFLEFALVGVDHHVCGYPTRWTKGSQGQLIARKSSGLRAHTTKKPCRSRALP